jgi:hypothetical protein
MLLNNGKHLNNEGQEYRIGQIKGRVQVGGRTNEEVKMKKVKKGKYS